MGKKLTEEEKAARDARRAEAVAAAKGKKRVKLLTVIVKDPNDPTILKIVATENDGLRTSADVAKWMDKTKFIGTVYPLRINQDVTRYEQTKFRTVVGGSVESVTNVK